MRAWSVRGRTAAVPTPGQKSEGDVDRRDRRGGSLRAAGPRSGSATLASSSPAPRTRSARWADGDTSTSLMEATSADSNAPALWGRWGTRTSRAKWAPFTSANRKTSPALFRLASSSTSRTSSPRAGGTVTRTVTADWCGISSTSHLPCARRAVARGVSGRLRCADRRSAGRIGGSCTAPADDSRRETGAGLADLVTYPVRGKRGAGTVRDIAFAAVQQALVPVALCAYRPDAEGHDPVVQSAAVAAEDLPCRGPRRHTSLFRFAFPGISGPRRGRCDQPVRLTDIPRPG